MSDADGGPASGSLSAERIEAIRKCMDERWGDAETRSVSDVLDDFDACADPSEQGSKNAKAVVTGWATPDMDDGSLLRRVKRAMR